MTILQYLERWNGTGAITPAQYDALSALARRDRMSVFAELNTLLYLGVVACVAGIGWTIQTHFASLGDAAILSALSGVFALCLYYCFSRSRPYSNGRVESPNFAFDYVLYLGCLVFGVELGFLEFRFHLLQDRWDNYLLLSACLYFVLAYRFDNRFVLSLALSTLAGWFGIRLSQLFPFGLNALRADALVYGGLVAIAGVALHRADIKKHFLEAYLHVAANVLFIALLSGVLDGTNDTLYLVGLLGLASIAIASGVRYRSFAFVFYGIVYGYLGFTARLTREMQASTTELGYIAISGTIIIVLLVVLARRFGREE